MAYAGYLLKAGGVEITTNPYIKLDSYIITPNQRLEISAERGTTGLLYRETVAAYKTKIEFETPMLNTTQMAALMSIITTAYTNVQKRELTLNYYVMDVDAYQTGTFYVPDIKYTIYRQSSPTNLFYEPTRIAFIEV